MKKTIQKIKETKSWFSEDKKNNNNNWSDSRKRVQIIKVKVKRDSK